MLNHRIRLITIAFLAVLGLVLLAGSVASAQGPTPTTAASTATATFTPTKVVTSTVAVTSTATTVPPTATKLPPTATLVPPTATKVPPTATLLPPTATKVPPTATKVPPTATKVPPTATLAARQPAAPKAGSGPRFFFQYTSSINLQNLTTTNTDALITIVYYNQDGSINATVNDTIPAANPFKSYFPIGATSPFNGSVVISSGQPLGAIVNVVGNNFAANASYDGSSTGSTTVSMPLLMANNSGYYTWFNVQNATTTSTDAVVNVSYTDGTSVGPITIKPGAAATFNQATEAHSQAIFAGSVTNATTNQPLVVTVIEENPSTLFAYSGFGSTGASTNPVMPLVNSNNSGWITGISVYNTSGSPSTVTLSYTPGVVNGVVQGTACTETQTIPGGKSSTFALNAFAGVPLAGMTTNCIGGAKFIGAAQVTSNSGNAPLTAIVNQLLPGQMGEAYGAFNPSNATSKVVMPLIMDRNSGWFTGINVMNVGGATTVNCTFTNTSYSFSQPLAAGGVFTLMTYGTMYSGYVGSGTCAGANPSTDKLVGVVNELGSGGGAVLMVYEGINQ